MAGIWDSAGKLSRGDCEAGVMARRLEEGLDCAFTIDGRAAAVRGAAWAGDAGAKDGCPIMVFHMAWIAGKRLRNVGPFSAACAFFAGTVICLRADLCAEPMRVRSHGSENTRDALELERVRDIAEVWFALSDRNARGTAANSISERRGGRGARLSCPYTEKRLVAGALAELDGDVHFFAAAIRVTLTVHRTFVVENEVDIQLTATFWLSMAVMTSATDGNSAACLLGRHDRRHECRRQQQAHVRGSLHKQTFFDGQVQELRQPATDRAAFPHREMPGARGPSFMRSLAMDFAC